MVAPSGIPKLKSDKTKLLGENTQLKKVLELSEVFNLVVVQFVQLPVDSTVPHVFVTLAILFSLLIDSKCYPVTSIIVVC